MSTGTSKGVKKPSTNPSPAQQNTITELMAKENPKDQANKDMQAILAMFTERKTDFKISQQWTEDKLQKLGDAVQQTDQQVKNLSAQITESNQKIQDNRKQILEQTGLPEVPKEIRGKIHAEITMEEVSQAIIKKQRSGKVPGTDGLPAEFYKVFQNILLDPMTQVCNEALNRSKIPNSWTETIITLIPKEEADLTDIKNYRPISLINADYKILASIMASRIKEYLNDFVHTDQNGFLPKRNTRNNIRTILNILEYYEEHSGKQFTIFRCAEGFQFFWTGNS